MKAVKWIPLVAALTAGLGCTGDDPAGTTGAGGSGGVPSGGSGGSAAGAGGSGGAPSCTPGSTQACVGPGACAGGQACLAGSGWGPCDCGVGGSGGTGGTAAGGAGGGRGGDGGVAGTGGAGGAASGGAGGSSGAGGATGGGGAGGAAGRGALNENWCLEHAVEIRSCGDVEPPYGTITWPGGAACGTSKLTSDFGAVPCYRFCGNNAGHTVSQCLAGWHSIDGSGCSFPSVYCVTDCAACP